MHSYTVKEKLSKIADIQHSLRLAKPIDVFRYLVGAGCQVTVSAWYQWLSKDDSSSIISQYVGELTDKLSE